MHACVSACGWYVYIYLCTKNDKGVCYFAVSVVHDVATGYQNFFAALNTINSKLTDDTISGMNVLQNPISDISYLYSLVYLNNTKKIISIIFEAFNFGAMYVKYMQ